MSKKDIIKKLAERIYGNVTEFEIQQCTQFCDTLVDIFIDSLIEGKKIAWKGFLSAEVIDRGERRGRNPQTNEVSVFPAIKLVKCKISPSIKDRINGK